MGLAFTVGNPLDALGEPFAELVRQRVTALFGDIVLLAGEEPPYCSDEVAWSGWLLLQERAANAVGAERLPQLLSMAAWCGCYLPAEVTPTTWRFDGQSAQIDVASLPGLLHELETIGAAIGLPTDDDSLRALADRYADDDVVDDDMEIQTYAQLFLAALIAGRRRQILWVVK